MLTRALFAFLHHAAFIAMMVALTIEVTLLRRDMSAEHARRIQRADAAYGLSALVLLVVGMLRVVYFEKGAAYYFGNAFFLIKLGLFVATGVLSIYPTLRFLKWDSATKRGYAPTVSESEFRKLRTLMHLELIALILIPLCAALMARGLG